MRGGVLTLCRDAVSVFYSPSQLGCNLNYIVLEAYSLTLCLVYEWPKPGSIERSTCAYIYICSQLVSGDPVGTVKVT